MMQWLMLDAGNEENAILEESKKVPTYLNAAVHYFCHIFTVFIDTTLYNPYYFDAKT